MHCAFSWSDVTWQSTLLLSAIPCSVSLSQHIHSQYFSFRDTHTNCICYIYSVIQNSCNFANRSNAHKRSTNLSSSSSSLSSGSSSLKNFRQSAIQFSSSWSSFLILFILGVKFWLIFLKVRQIRRIFTIRAIHFSSSSSSLSSFFLHLASSFCLGFLQVCQIRQIFAVRAIQFLSTSSNSCQVG